MLAPALGFERAAGFAVQTRLCDAAVTGLAPTHLSLDWNLSPAMSDAAFATVCDAVGVNPWTALGTGTLVLAVDPAGVEDVLVRLADVGVPAADAGEVVTEPELVVGGDAAEAPPAGVVREALVGES